MRDHHDIAELEDALVAQLRVSAERTDLQRRRRLLVDDRGRALGYVRRFAETAAVDGDVSPVAVARDLALAARPGGGVEFGQLEAVTATVIETAPVVSTSSWWPEVLWGWPGLPRVALAFSESEPGVWTLMVAALPGLQVAVDGTGFAGDLLRHRGSDGRAWATLSTVSGFLVPPPPGRAAGAVTRKARGGRR